MKSRFNRTFNAVYGKIGKTASHDVILELVESKCLPVLLYGVDVVPLSKSDFSSIEFTFNRVLMKIFRTSSISVINECMTYFKISSLDSTVSKRKSNFLCRYIITVDNMLCHCFCKRAEEELSSLYRRYIAT